MRLFLVPISPGRTLLYCQKIDALLPKKRQGYLDKITTKASEIWTKWETSDTRWKKSLVTYGHRVLQRIPYEEWALKSVPPLSARREAEELNAHIPVDLLYPRNAIPDSKIIGLLRKLAIERRELHWRRMWGSLLLSPLTAPIGLIPIIPNIPFFYLVYRGWSHWRAWSGSKHLEFLLDNKFVKPITLPELERFYSKLSRPTTAQASRTTPFETDYEASYREGETFIEASDAKELAKALDAPELAPEVERAVGQVKHMLEQHKK